MLRTGCDMTAGGVDIIDLGLYFCLNLGYNLFWGLCWLLDTACLHDRTIEGRVGSKFGVDNLFITNLVFVEI